MDKQTLEIQKRIGMEAAFGSLRNILKTDLPICFKSTTKQNLAQGPLIWPLSISIDRFTSLRFCISVDEHR